MKREPEPPPCGVRNMNQIRFYDETDHFAGKLIKCRLLAPAKHQGGLPPTVNIEDCQAERERGAKSSCALTGQVPTQPRKRFDAFHNKPPIILLRK